jgi:hypothetical protein
MGYERNGKDERNGKEKGGRGRKGKGVGKEWDYMAETMINLLLGNPFSHLVANIFSGGKYTGELCPKQCLLCTHENLVIFSHLIIVYSPKRFKIFTLTKR